MLFSSRRKVMLFCLMVYWPALFVMTHIPLPHAVQTAHVSDKGLHFVAYFLLVLLVWGTVKPHERVRWNQATVWWVLLVLLGYGALDEWSQQWIAGRFMDLGDYYADIGATFAGLVLLSCLTFWPALLGGGALAITLAWALSTFS